MLLRFKETTVTYVSKKYRAITHIGDYGIRVKIKAAKLPKTRRLQFFRRENDKVITSIYLA